MSRFFSHPKALVESKSIGEGTRIWAFSHVMPGARIGRDCNIGDHCFIEAKSVIGDRVTVKNGVSVWDGVTLGDDVFVGPNAVFTNDLFPVSRKHSPFLPTKIAKGACIGANATVVCGITIGEYAFIGAGTIVTKNIPAYALAYGHPARIKGYVCRCRKRLKFELKTAKCRCGLRYKRASKDRIQVQD